MRRLHSIAGLAGALIVVFMALTGAILSVQLSSRPSGTVIACAHAIGSR